MENNLPSAVTVVTTDTGKEIYLVGTAHVSKQSVEDVRKTVQQVNPDSICVELCEARYKSLMDRDRWKNMDIFDIIRKKRAVLLMAQLVMASFYRRLGSKLDIKPGAEMIEGINLAKARGQEPVMADRNIEVTLKRVWGSLGFWSKIKMASEFIAALFMNETIDEKMVEEMKNRDQLENILATFAVSFPQVKSTLIDERDIYLAQQIRSAPGQKVVAVVGAGHVAGIVNHISKQEPIDRLMELPPKSVAPTVIGWSIPACILVLFVAGFFKGGFKYSLDFVYLWILVTGSLSALGAALALAHPLTIIASFIAAPFTTLNPLIAVGMVSGLVQAMVKKPTVTDMEDLHNAITSVKGFWRNPATRILLVFVMANLGGSLGTFVAGSWIAGKLF